MLVFQVRNVSRKPYGRGCIEARLGGTCLTDPELLFNLTNDINADHEVLDLHDFLDPGGEVTIRQTFEVPTLDTPFRDFC